MGHHRCDLEWFTWSCAASLTLTWNRTRRQRPELVAAQPAPPLAARHSGTDSCPDLVRWNILPSAACSSPGPEYAICQPRRARYRPKPSCSDRVRPNAKPRQPATNCCPGESRAAVRHGPVPLEDASALRSTCANRLGPVWTAWRLLGPAPCVNCWGLWGGVTHGLGGEPIGKITYRGVWLGHVFFLGPSLDVDPGPRQEAVARVLARP